MLKEKNAVTIMDAACGTGVDSVMLIEERNWLTLKKDVPVPGFGFAVTIMDAACGTG